MAQKNDEYTPPQIDEAICKPLKAVAGIQCRANGAEGLSKCAKKL